MKKPTTESLKIAKGIRTFLTDYAPIHKTNSEHTLKGYRNALSLYLEFLEKESRITPFNLSMNCFSLEFIEKWMGSVIILIYSKRHN